MVVIRASGFQRIYRGLLLSLVGWVLMGLSYELISLFAAAFQNYESSDMLINLSHILRALFDVIQVLAAMTIVTGLSEAYSFSPYLKRARIWFLTRLFFSSLFVIVNAISLALQNQSIALEWLDSIIGLAVVVGVLDSCGFLLLGFLANWCLLKGIAGIVQDYGGDERSRRKLLRLRVMLTGVCSILIAVFIGWFALLYWLLLIDQNTDSVSKILIACFLSLTLALLLMACLRLTVQALVVRRARKVWKTIQEISE